MVTLTAITSRDTRIHTNVVKMKAEETMTDQSITRERIFAFFEIA